MALPGAPMATSIPEDADKFNEDDPPLITDEDQSIKRWSRQLESQRTVARTPSGSQVAEFLQDTVQLMPRQGHGETHHGW